MTAGLKLPPRIAPVQAVIIPIQQKKEGVLENAARLEEALRAAGVRVKVDATDKSPGFKFAEQEMRGIPVRIECGPKDIEAGQAVVVRRDTREKITVALEELAVKVPQILESIQKDMLETARAHRDSHTYVARDYQEFVKTINEKPGFIKAMWCGDQACEDRIKEDTAATSRCIPFEQEQISDVCVCLRQTGEKNGILGPRLLIATAEGPDSGGSAAAKPKTGMAARSRERTESVRLQLPAGVSMIIDVLRTNGYEAFAVGGCVRDSVLGRKPDDWDITTSATPWQVKALFPRTVDTGLQHGTVTVLAGGQGYEVTTYRIDGEYKDGRHPSQVEFTGSLAEDLKRRDFTVNAMAYSRETGLIDLFGGMEDLQRKVIRCVGDPRKRFGEDALRILRAVRFAAQLGFSIEGQTVQAICELAPP